MRQTALVFLLSACVLVLSCGSSGDPSVLGISASSPLGTESALAEYLVSLGYTDKGIRLERSSQVNMLWVGSGHIFEYKLPKKRSGSVQVIVDGGDVIGIYSDYTGDEYLDKEGNVSDAPGKVFDDALLGALDLRVLLKDTIPSELTAKDTAFEYSGNVFVAQRTEGSWMRNLIALKKYEDKVHLFY
jgi:hypothetical protein